MEKYIAQIKNTSMFQGISEDEIRGMLSCLSARVTHYEKNEYIIRNGDQVTFIGILLSGQALIENEDFWGRRTIIQEIMPGMLFAESYACLTQIPVDICVKASEATDVMFFDFSKIMTVCGSACSFHNRLVQNLLRSVAAKNVSLTKKMDFMSKKTIRERLLSYLSTESLKAGRTTFTIPFSRQELADFLSVDRSALSNEISKLQKEGIISCQKSAFRIH